MDAIEHDADRAELITALRHAVDGEARFGKLSPVLPDLTARWERVIDAMERLCLKKPQTRKK